MYVVKKYLSSSIYIWSFLVASLFLYWLSNDSTIQDGLQHNCRSVMAI